ncbi:MAG TPA: phosphatidate cytidylyltransferase, partial [Myxococcota bacterium]|nr:phosphatidate cytidylyltransferase [Myxococcota bacterium]
AKRSNLSLRLTTAAILVPTILWVIATGGLLYLAVVVGIVLLGLREFYSLIESKGADPLVTPGMVAGAALPVVAYVGNEYHATLLMTAVLLGVMVAQLRKAQISEAMASISGTFFGVFYVGWLLSHAIVLRNFHAAVSAHHGRASAEQLGILPDTGIFLMIFCLAAVVLCDAGAYFAGRRFGRRKLAPRISPGKTIEGSIGGLAAGTIGALAAKGVFDLFWPALSAPLAWQAALAMGFLVSVAAMTGDLVESLLKRDAQTKDSGQMLPGMGGIMDRIDSPLLGIPVMYYLMIFYIFLEAAAP